MCVCACACVCARARTIIIYSEIMLGSQFCSYVFVVRQVWFVEPSSLLKLSGRAPSQSMHHHRAWRNICQKSPVDGYRGRVDRMVASYEKSPFCRKKLQSVSMHVATLEWNTVICHCYCLYTFLAIYDNEYCSLKFFSASYIARNFPRSLWRNLYSFSYSISLWCNSLKFF